jgi:hypothetical protein
MPTDVSERRGYPPAICWLLLARFSTLKMEVMCSCETSVHMRNYTALYLRRWQNSSFLLLFSIVVELAGGTQTEGVSVQGAEENIWAGEGGGDGSRGVKRLSTRRTPTCDLR